MSANVSGVRRGPWAEPGLRAGPEDDEEETPIGDPDEDDWEGEEWDEDDDEEPIRALPHPPQGPGDADDDELPMGDPPDDDPTDDPDDEDEGEGDEEPLHGLRGPRRNIAVQKLSCTRAAGR